MTDKFTNELLSAWYDRETSSAEGAQVERQLEASPAANSELDDFGKLSALVKNLPAQSAPDGFRAAVMQAVERETLLAVPVSDSDPTNPTRRAWRQGVAAIAASALALVVMVELLKTPTVPSSDVNIAGTESDGNDPRAESSDMAPPATTVAAAPKRDDALVADETARFRGTADAPAEDSDADSAAASNLVKLNPELENAAAPSDNEARAGRSQLVFDDSLKRADVGQIVEALETIDGEVAVVRLTVVDRRKGLDALQVLLSRNKILQETTAAGNYREQDKQEKSDGAEPLVAVFVEASGEQLAQALLQLNAQDSIQSLEIEQPIAAGELAMVEGIAPAFERSAAVTNSAVESVKKNKRGTPSFKKENKAAAGRILAKADAAKPQKPGSFGGAKEAESKSGRGQRFARQQQVLLSPEVLSRRRDLKRMKLQLDRAGSPAPTRPKDPAGAAATFADNVAIRRKSPAPRSLQVLFVLVPSNAPQPAAAPAEKRPADEKPDGAA